MLGLHAVSDDCVPLVCVVVLQEWVEYDEKKGESVGVYEIEHKFVIVK